MSLGRHLTPSQHTPALETRQLNNGETMDKSTYRNNGSWGTRVEKAMRALSISILLQQIQRIARARLLLLSHVQAARQFHALYLPPLVTLREAVPARHGLKREWPTT